MGILKRVNIFSISSSEVQETIEQTGSNAVQAASYVAGNKTEAI